MRRWLALFLACCASLSSTAMAGWMTLPTDISVNLIADPASGLQTGQLVIFTISVTNHGPEAANLAVLGSTPVHGEIDVYSTSSNCDNTLGIAIVELADSFYYQYDWQAVSLDSPIASGETRSCSFSVEYTDAAPAAFPFTFEFPKWLVDLDGSNNASTVTLLRGGSGNPPVPVPVQSPGWLLLLAASLLLSAAARTRLPSLVKTGRTRPNVVECAPEAGVPAVAG